MEPTQELVDALYQDEVRHARQMLLGEKLFAGAELFEMASQITLAGIRHQFPNADAEQALEILRKRLKLAERMENGA